MAFSFTDIERSKTTKIFLIFLALFVFYLPMVYLGVYFSSMCIYTLEHDPGLDYQYNVTVVREINNAVMTPFETCVILLITVVFALLHLYNAATDNIQSILKILRAHPPDPADSYHRRFMDTAEEVRAAAGGMDFECVIAPTAALNAFSAAELRRRPVIGITEGLLYRLNKEQLASVIAHETAHISSQDTLIKSIAASVFGIYSCMLFPGIWVTRFVMVGRGMLSPLFWVAMILFLGLGKICGIFVSRMCEYRADAEAVRLVRDPLSLAQSLYIMGTNWRGSGAGYAGIESIFILNPENGRLDEKENMVADLISTHPPLMKRIDILLDMAHAGYGSLEQETAAASAPATGQPAAAPRTEQSWYVYENGKWTGPFSFVSLMRMNILRNDSFIRTSGNSKIGFARNDETLQEMIITYAAKKKGGVCRHCFETLEPTDYEGVSLLTCRECKGILISLERLKRILIRENRVFSEETVRRAQLIEKTAATLPPRPAVKIEKAIVCPRCEKEMERRFYSLPWPVEVDWCLPCGLLWLDHETLEILQYLAQKIPQFSIDDFEGKKKPRNKPERGLAPRLH